MTWPRKIALVVFGMAVLILGAFTVRSMVRHGEVLPGVSAGGIGLGRLGRADADRALLALEDRLVTSPVAVVVEGTSLQLDPAQVEFVLDREGILTAAFDAGRRSGFQQFADWVTARTYVVPLSGRISSSAVDQLIDGWEAEEVVVPAFDGTVAYQDGRLVAQLPRPGLRIDRESAADAILQALLDNQTRTAVLEVVEAAPVLSVGDVEAGLEAAADLISGPITLESLEPPVEVVFSHADLGRALTSRIVSEPELGILLGFDPEVIAEVLRPWVASLEAPPEDARISITEDDAVVIVAGRSGTVVDAELIAAELLVAAHLPGRRAPLPFATGVEPDFTTADAEALGIVRKVSEFTTFHSCCQPRVTNIQRMADLVDGVIIQPGEEFSLNGHVGLRTEENGFVEAPMILRGEFVPAVGGGVSQFATTLFNAVFFGGYEDVYHQPHSYYFSRYPEAREATVSFPNPELIFRNDTASALLIRTEHTDESITVKLFGDNEGRKVTDALSPRRDFREPVTEYVANSGVAPGTEVVVQRGTTGWTVTLTRTISHPNGTEQIEEWDWTYRPQPRVVRVHPCDIPGSGVTCPTTTTLPPPTTTTTTMPTTTSTSSTSTTLP